MTMTMTRSSLKSFFAGFLAFPALLFFAPPPLLAKEDGALRDLSVMTMLSRRASSLHEAARRGDVYAQYALATLYAKGAKDMPPDKKKAAHFLTMAAERGLLSAQTQLASRYAYGTEGFGRDYQAAARWYRLAAMQGDLLSQYNLGVILKRGLGGKKNPAEAARWWLLAAERGSLAAQYRLAFLYYRGEGVDKNSRAARHWLAKAAEQGHEEAQYYLGLFLRDGVGGSAEIERGEAWLRRAAMGGHGESSYALAALYLAEAPRARAARRQKLLREAYIWSSVAAARRLDAGDSKAEELRKSAARHMTAQEGAEAEKEARRIRRFIGESRKARRAKGGRESQDGLRPAPVPTAELRMMDKKTLLVRGELGIGAPERIEKFLAKNPAVTVLALDSPGGYLTSGLAIAEIVRARGLITRAEKRCHSACTFVLFASPRPTANSESVIGFHKPGSFFKDAAGSARQDQEESGSHWLMRSHYAWSGFPKALIDKILATPFENLVVFSKADLIHNRLLAYVRDEASGRQIRARQWCDSNWNRCRKRQYF